MGKGTTTRKDNTTSAPPAWALPLLTTAANAGMNLYNSGQGFNTPYIGRTVADFNPTRLAAMNNILKLTGGGAPVTNDSIFGQNQQLQNIQQLIAARQAQNQAAMRPPTPMPVQPTPMPQPQSYAPYAPNSPGRMGSNR